MTLRHFSCSGPEPLFDTIALDHGATLVLYLDAV